MALKTVLETLDGVPEALRPMYVENDGKFHLDIEDDIRSHPKVSALSNAYNQEKTKRQKANTELAALTEKLKVLPEDFDPDEYAQLKASASGQNLDEQIKTLKDQHHKSLEALREKQAKELKERDDKFSALDNEIDSTLLRSTTKDALLEAGVNPDLLAGAMGIVRNKAKVQRTDKGERQVFAENEHGEEVQIKDFVKGWLSSAEGKPYLGTAKGPGGRGNNSGTNGGGSTMTRADFNKLNPTQQMETMKKGDVSVID
jgi:hypothetical protein